LKRTLPDIKLIRTDTTFDLSREAEKNEESTVPFLLIYIQPFRSYRKVAECVMLSTKWEGDREGRREAG